MIVFQSSLDGERTKPSPIKKESGLQKRYQTIFTSSWTSDAIPVPRTLEEYVEMFGDKAELPYRSDFYPPKIGNHNGQRKLFNALVGFLSRVTKLQTEVKTPGRTDICVYAGAAPNEYGALISRMFPEIKFIYVDPSTFKIQPMGGSLSGQQDPVHIQYLANKEEASNIDLAEGIKLLRRVESGPNGIYIINGIMTDGIAEAVKKVFGRTIFISDIRTNMTTDQQPDSLDIFWNLAQTYIWCKIMEPTYSQFKWRHPFYDISDQEFLKYANSPPFSEVFAKAKKYGVDFVKNALDHELVFFDGLQYIQSSPPKSSTELRLECGPILELKNYGRPETNDAQLFAWNSVYRTFQLYENLMANPLLGFCCCGDCALLADTFREYFEIRDQVGTNGLYSSKRDEDSSSSEGEKQGKMVGDILARLEKITGRTLIAGNHQGLYSQYPEDVILHVFQVCAAAAAQRKDPQNVFPWQ